MSDAETIVNTFSDPEIMSDSETLSDGTMGDDEHPSGRKRALRKFKTDSKSEQNGGFTQGVEAAIPMSATAIEDSVVKRCMGKLKREASHLKRDSHRYSFRINGLQNEYDDLQSVVFGTQESVSALEKANGDLQREVREPRDEVKELSDEMSRKRRIVVTDGIEEEAPKLKRRRVEIQHRDDTVCIVLG